MTLYLHGVYFIVSITNECIRQYSKMNQLKLCGKQPLKNLSDTVR